MFWFACAHKERGEIRRGKVDVCECRLVSNCVVFIFTCSCLRDQAMFARKRLIVNNGYETISSDEEREEEES